MSWAPGECVQAPRGAADSSLIRFENKPATQERLRIQKGVSSTADRAAVPAASGNACDELNPMQLFKREHMSAETRFRFLEREQSVQLYSSPEALANATARLVVENEALTPEQKLSELRKNIDRQVAMRSYLRTANVDAEETERIMHQTQIDMLTDGVGDATVAAFEKRAKHVFDKKLKAKQKASDGQKNDNVSIEKVVAAVVRGMGGRGNGGKGGEDKGGGRGNDGGRGGDKHGGRGGGKGKFGGPGDQHYSGCFICGKADHRARDCPEK